MGIPLTEFIENIEGEILTPAVKMDGITIEDGYVSDLLSDVMGNARENQAWITIMKHLNSVAVASLVNIPCVVFAKGVKPDKDVISRAETENVCLITTALSSFEVAGKLYKLLHD
jgi:serine kinase of HPr protein (carbohydrate metabolism regulator)